MKIVSLEDDEPFWELLKDALKDSFQGPDLQWIRTESEFYEELVHFAASPPDIFLLDVMVKWADPAEVIKPAPENVQRENYYRAGLRCRERLREYPATAQVPVILFTVLEQNDVERVTNGLPEGTHFVGKSGAFGELINRIKNLTG